MSGPGRPRRGPRAADLGRVSDPELAEVLALVAARRSSRAPEVVVGRTDSATGSAAVAAGSGTGDGSKGHGSKGHGSKGAVQLRVLGVLDVGPTLRLIRTERPRGFTFRAGQHVKAGVAGVGRSSFSLASAPHEAHLELCVGLVPGGKVSPALFGLSEGSTVELVPRAKGSFVLDESASVHLMVATSTGIGPLRSMLRDALERGLPGRFVVRHGATAADRLPYREELAALARRASAGRVAGVRTPGAAPVDYVATVTGSGGVRADELAEQVAAGLDPSSTVVYACGHPGMIGSVRSRLPGFTVRSEAF